jgi:peptidoglycan/xylan/chitin deacetylase (PgdA/CDA1 family)
VALTALVDLLGRGVEPDGLAAVVFDDCLVGVHHHALPILAELGIPSTVFTVSEALGSPPPWWQGSGRVATRDELLEMHAAGVAIGSHTRHHPSLPTLRGQALLEELAGSRADLEQLVQEPVDLLAYPFGHHDPVVRAAAQECGYRAAFTFLNGRVVLGLDRLMLPRINMHDGLGTVRLAHHLARPAAWWPDTQTPVVAPALDSGPPGVATGPG